MSDGTKIAEEYMSSILAQQHPCDLSQLDIDSGGQGCTLFLELLRVDSLQNLGQVNKAKESLTKLNHSPPGADDSSHTKFFRHGLTNLLEGDLLTAYDCFLQASHEASGLEAVFYGERAVNVSSNG